MRQAAFRGGGSEFGMQRKNLSHQMVKEIFYGAGDEARTRYLHLGKVALYQMSYTRMQELL